MYVRLSSSHPVGGLWSTAGTGISRFACLSAALCALCGCRWPVVRSKGAKLRFTKDEKADNYKDDYYKDEQKYEQKYDRRDNKEYYENREYRRE
jgi:hypothetical protein